MTARQVAFRAVGVKKHYPGVKALDGVDLEGYAGSVMAVCGANGAGKSTFARLLAGVESPTEGEITVTGFPHPVRNPAEAEQAGVLMMFQEPLIIDDFTVGENVWLYTLRQGTDIRAWANKADTNGARTREVLDGVGLGHLSTRGTAGELSPGQRQMLSLSRAAVTEHKILILDETTASTSEEHFDSIVELVEREKQAGTSILFVSHRLNEVFAMCDRIAVLRNGRLVEVLEASETNADEVTTLMIGEALKALDRPAPFDDTGAAPVVEVRDLHGGSAKGVSFDVRPGEIVGLYGLVGSGRSSVARTITGQRRAAGGTIRFHGEEIRLATPGQAVAKHIAYLTEDRRLEGFINDFDNGTNMSIVALPKMSRFGVIPVRAERSRVRTLIDDFQVKGGTRTLTSTLSGGNQQKVVIAKWLETDPEFVVLDEPTKGIDVGARANIYEIIHGLAARGKGVLVVSSEADELLSLCHRILVMRNGEIAGEFDPETADTDDLIRTALTHED
ncbi:ribose transport system ATP-binding protein/L-arabinose transport system ATP-binding protein [Propionibacteriaceae bacterium ES.041]|uniref:Sugar ABC transporter ATP-binding protein n=1 Tax=Enemella evansiae TaxID=2016499 RepID=A0A255G849_9ACTN|nr:sugar ABC transporter ATP-binding protein [Enemella evansiae]OYN98240.1 sugar ABC transporter ATP-binding protein [Enemella evansiae]OYN99292.1 sugar ABC transporter ATP-binding protein [Enemella evansiae]OYO10576.1 sugar ABC transporter ATP-binding protein [Enemella evansiae]PFG67139.1 ribose transport system ATP-binding protein/L-arabinose transport system ATP-binding protein [Propionibacteriaceae bacterium ES.041]